MNTLVTIMLAIVLELITPLTIETTELKSNVNHIDVEEVLLYLDDRPTVTQRKNC